MSEIASVSAADFETEVVQSGQPVVVDFWAEWCPPCKMLAPVLDGVARQFAGRVKVVKCDIDRDEALSEQYGVQKIPTLIFFKDGQIVDQTVGYVSQEQLSAKFNEVLGS